MRSYAFEYDSRWPDLLTAYDGHSIIYDEIGNPTSYYNGTSYTMSWAQGRRLETIQTGNKTISFAYDMDGIRRSKTVVTDTDAKRTTSQTDFITQGGLIVQQTTVTTVLTKSTDATTTTTRVLEFTYDSQQRPFCVLDTYTKTDGTQSQTRYYYVLNLQGDVVALMTASGSIWATYTYDAWGKPLQVLNGSNTALSSISDYFANVNPLRYRGYYYDVETGFYYLQSRYYDPGIGRFVNADGQYDTDLNGGLNMFAYCGNNPVNNSDPDGTDWQTAFAIGATVAIVGLIVLGTIGTGGGALALAGIAASATAFATATAVANVTIATGLTLAGGALIYAATSGGRRPTQLGKDGEQQAGIDPTKKKPVEMCGRNRIPDALSDGKLTEVKNVRYISNTLQLRDYASFANATSRTLELIVRAGDGTKVAKTVVQAGWNIIRLIK